MPPWFLRWAVREDPALSLDCACGALYIHDGEVDPRNGPRGATKLIPSLDVHRERRAPRNLERGGLSPFIAPDLFQTKDVMIENAGVLYVAGMHPDRVELSNRRDGHRHTSHLEPRRV